MLLSASEQDDDEQDEGSQDEENEILDDSSPDDTPDTAPSQSSSDPPPTVPPNLLTKLLHHHFKNENTKIGVEARSTVGKYMETFIREAIARAAFERQESADQGKRGLADDFLEVEDLEKLAPQMLLDF